MTKHFIKLASIIAAASVLGATVRAQDAPKGPVPLRLQVVISKYQGDKKISSLPYTVSVSDKARASLRMGGQVPIVTTVTVGQGAEAKQQPSVQYRDVGTSIDVTAFAIDDARYRLDLTIEDSSVYTETPSQAGTLRGGDHPAFRSFRSSDSLILRDGQSVQYTTATDKISGEVVKVDVTLTVVK